MTAGCVRWMLSHATRTISGGSLVCRTSASRFIICRDRQNLIGASRRWFPFCTDTDVLPEPKKTKQIVKINSPIGSVGRKIPHKLIQVISDDGEDRGTMHRAEALKFMDEKGLKLVLLNDKKDPPIYKLMSGKQIHEEQVKQREKKKAKAAPVQVKELTFSAGIASHDLSTKLKQVESWLEKKHHVRMTLRSASRDPVANLDKTLELMLEQIEVTVGFVAKPQVIRDGQAAMCILRPPSAKELAQKGKNKDGKSSSTPSKNSDSKMSSVSSTKPADESIEQ